MDQRNLRELKSFLQIKNSAGGCMLWAAGVIFAAAAVFATMTGVEVFVEQDDGMLMPFVCLLLLMLFFGTLLFLSLVWPRIKVARQTREWAKSSQLEEIVADFVEAKQLPSNSGNVRLGNKWIFGRATGAPVLYEDITALKLQTIRTSYQVLETSLFATLKNGRSSVVYREFGASKISETTKSVIAVIMAHNPSVRLR